MVRASVFARGIAKYSLIIGGAPHDCHQALLPSLGDESSCGMQRPTKAKVGDF